MQKKQYTNESMLESLRACFEANKKISQNIYAKGKYKPSVDAITQRYGSWNEALSKAGIPVYTRKNGEVEKIQSKRYSEEFIFQQLRACYIEHGEISMTIYNKSKRKPGRTLITKQFGSWNNAIQAAGLPSLDNHERVYTNEMVFEQIRSCYKENNNFISADIYIASGRIPKIGTIHKYFGSWNSAVEKAGITPNDSNIVIYSKEDIVDALWKIYHENNGILTVELYKLSEQKPGFQTIQKKFGSWNNALKNAGIPLNKEMPQKYTKQELIQVLQSFYKLHNKISRNFYFDNATSPHLHTIIYYFGTWEKALEASGINVSRDNRQYSREDMLKSIRKCIQLYGETAFISAYIENGYEPKIATIRREFGSWEEAVNIATKC